MNLEPVRISSSIVRSWQTCERQWWFAYYRDLQKKEGAHPASAVGQFVHTWLEWYYKPGHPSDPQAKMEEKAQEWITLAPELKQSINEALILSTTMVGKYPQWLEDSRMDRDLEWTDTESHISVEMGEGTEITLTMKLDNVGRRKSTGLPIVMDHKSVQSLGQDEPFGRLNPQFRTYDLGMFLHTGVVHDGVLVNELRRVDSGNEDSKPPYFARWEVRWSIDERRFYWIRLVNIANQIRKAKSKLDAGMDHRQVLTPSPNSQECKRCDFRIPCLMTEDGSNVEGYIAENYKVEKRI